MSVLYNDVHERSINSQECKSCPEIDAVTSQEIFDWILSATE